MAAEGKWQAPIDPKCDLRCDLKCDLWYPNPRPLELLLPLHRAAHLEEQGVKERRVSGPRSGCVTTRPFFTGAHLDAHLHLRQRGLAVWDYWR